MTFSLLWSGSAMAEPETPVTSDEAQQAYLDSARRAGELNEQVLVAQEAEKAAVAAASTAGKQVTSAAAAAEKAKERSAAADRAAAAYREKVDAFANASFRGARLSQMSALLTAGSADDLLDQVSSLDRVAADTQVTLDAAEAAKNAAAQAQTDATASQAAAEKAKTDADAARTAAAKATDDATARKSTLDAEAARYKELYESLSEQERQAAEEAERRANEEAAAAAAAAAEAAAAEQAAAEAPAPVAADRADRAPLEEAPAEAAPAEEAPAEEAPAEAPAAEPSSEAPAPAPAAPSGNSAASAAVAAALSKEGSAYVYGAAGPSAFDCSGLTSWAWAQAGVTIPRTSGGQAGLPQVSLSELQPGDLVTYYSPVSHVAMYIGGGQVIHASTESRPVYITSVEGAGPNPTGHRVG
ncbi:C40 family peptidase [Nakamurella sp. GG22]